MSSQRAMMSQKSALQILPCTVSQLLSAAVCDWEPHQVTVVGVVRGYAPFVTYTQYSVDDMTGPPLNVKQWVNDEGALVTPVSPGTYVKVSGSLRSYNGQRSLLAMKIRCITDLNEITSHMLEVVHAHMRLYGKVYDVNMNTTSTLLSVGGHPDGFSPDGLSTIQDKVLDVIRRFSVRPNGISLNELKIKLSYLPLHDIRSLRFLINEGHVYSDNDEQHFKSTL